MANIMALGGGPSQFSIAAGQPVSTLAQTDVGLFVQDSWRVDSHTFLERRFALGRAE